MSIKITTNKDILVSKKKKMNLQLEISGGKYPYTWIPLGKLPKRIKLGPSGVLKGHPQTNGTFKIPVKVTDSLGNFQKKVFNLTIMEYIEKLFLKIKKEPSDINEHLETLKQLSSECKVAVEFGVRGMVSTLALATSGCKNIYGYDITCPSGHNPNRYENLKFYCNTKKINLNFIKGDVLNLKSIPECDLLFIDTFHSYKQLKAELFLFSKYARKYIVMHDTAFFGERDECCLSNEQWYEKYKLNNRVLELFDINCKKEGLKNAIKDFLNKNNDWKIFKIFENNNGLTILKKN